MRTPNRFFSTLRTTRPSAPAISAITTAPPAPAMSVHTHTGIQTTPTRTRVSMTHVGSCIGDACAPARAGGAMPASASASATTHIDPDHIRTRIGSHHHPAQPHACPHAWAGVCTASTCVRLPSSDIVGALPQGWCTRQHAHRRCVHLSAYWQ
ncbi:hypothetical protein PLICRDRAFT_174435 [Plicaturopsis crispa FD-325 SS-3]|nr:hypothetical protein PLICRDRAFT_174435 [Plicaturopsis crispa FD-325 SS-3]